MTPVVSVLLTAFNREKYLADSIESVLNQRFTDFELIVVDDASTDGTQEIAQRYAREDPRLRVVLNPQRLGQFANRNSAASHARGRFLKYHDSDDLMYPHCLETMVTLLEAEPRAGFGLSTGWAWPGGPAPMLLSPRQCYQREFLGFGLFMCGPASALFRTSVFRALGGFPEEGVHSDHLFWLKACAREHVLLLPADLFWYREHPTQDFASDRARSDYARVPGAVWNALASRECPLAAAELEQARRNHVWSVAKHLWRDLKGGRGQLARYRWQQSGLRISDWIRYLRPPRRSALAGTPLSDSGEYVVPAWTKGHDRHTTHV